MRRGTTTTFCFDTPFLASEIEMASIAFTEEGDEEPILIKRSGGPGVDVQDMKLYVTLTEKESLAFSPEDHIVEMEYRLKLVGGKRAASDIPKVCMRRILEDGEL